MVRAVVEMLIPEAIKDIKRTEEALHI